MVKNITISEIESLLRLQGKFALASISDKLSDSGISIDNAAGVIDDFQNFIYHQIARRLKHNHRALPLTSEKDAVKYAPRYIKLLEKTNNIKFDKPTREACQEFLATIFKYSGNIEASGRLNKDPYEEKWAWIETVLDLCNEQGTTPEVLLDVKPYLDEITRRLYTKEGYISRYQRQLQATSDMEGLLNGMFEMSMSIVANQQRLEEKDRYKRLIGYVLTPFQETYHSGWSKADKDAYARQYRIDHMLRYEKELADNIKEIREGEYAKNLRLTLENLQPQVEAAKTLILEEADRIYG